MTAGAGQSEQDSQNRTVRTGQSEQDSQNRTLRTGCSQKRLPEQRREQYSHTLKNQEVLSYPLSAGYFY
jgi:hypothetical protein